MRAPILFLTWLAISAGTYAQVFQQAWRGGGSGNTDVLTSIAPVSDGTTVVAGVLSEGAQLFDIAVPFQQGFVGKIDSNGEMLWVQPAGLGSPYLYICPAVAVDDSGFVFVTGWFVDSTLVGDATLIAGSGPNFFLACFAADGALLWAETAGQGATSSGIALTPEGDPVVIGYTSGTATIGGTIIQPYGTGAVDIVVARFDRDGALTWVRQAGGPGLYGDVPQDVEVDQQGNVLIAGKIRNLSQFDTLTLQCTITSPDCSGGFIAKYDAVGTIQWVRNAGMDCFAVDTDSSGNVYITGDHSFDLYFDSLLVEGHSGTDHYTARLDPAGNYQWLLVPPEGDLELTFDIVTDPAGTSYVVGYSKDTMLLGGFTVNEDDYGDFLLYAVDADGEVQWFKNGSVPSGGSSAAYAVALSDDCGLFVGGTFGNAPAFPLDALDLGAVTGYDLWLAQLDRCDLTTGERPPAERPWLILFPDPATDNIQLQGIEGSVDYAIIDAMGGIVLRGRTSATSPISVSALPAGGYFLRLERQGEPSKVLRFIRD